MNYELRSVIKDWQAFARELSTILGCSTVTDDIISAVKKLKGGERRVGVTRSILAYIRRSSTGYLTLRQLAEKLYPAPTRNQLRRTSYVLTNLSRTKRLERVHGRYYSAGTRSLPPTVNEVGTALVTLISKVGPVTTSEIMNYVVKERWYPPEPDIYKITRRISASLSHLYRANVIMRKEHSPNRFTWSTNDDGAA